jgi:RHS repeat-associated protein
LSPSRLVSIFLTLFSISLLASASARSQTTTYVPSVPDNALTPADPIGIPPEAGSTGTNESINLSSGSLSFFIPALTLPQRGGWNLTLGYVHNSNSWISQQNVTVGAGSYNEGKLLWGDTYTYVEDMIQSGSGGLGLNLPILKASIEYEGDLKAYQEGNQFAQVPVFCVTNWVFYDWSGNKHSFSPGGRSECNATSNYPGATSVTMPTNGTVLQKSQSTDGSFLSLDTTNFSDIHVITKSGTVYHFSGYVQQWPSQPTQVTQNQENIYQATFSSLVDTNGNTVSYNSNTGVLTDTIGRQITITSGGGISYKDSNGNQQSITLSAPNYGTSAPYTFSNFSNGCRYSGPGFEYPFGTTVSTGNNSFNLAPFTMTLAFPAATTGAPQRTYQLQFDQLSRLIQVTYPSGGYTQYSYKDFYGNLLMGQVYCDIDFQQVQQKIECTLSSGSCSSSQQPVTSYSAVMVGGNSPYNETIDVTDPTGARVHHVFTTSLTYPQINPEETETDVYSPSGTLLRTTTRTNWIVCALDLAVPGTITTSLEDASPVLSSQEVRQYQESGCYDNPTQINVYDYASSGTGPLLKETSQVWEPASAFTPANILDRLESRTITDPNAGTQATLTYGYDALGNITSKQVGGTSVATLSSSYLRDSYGDITQYTDPKGNITKFGYTDTWTQTTCAPPSNSSAYLTSITDALSHVTNFSYDSCTGAKATDSDPNHAQTSYSYDALGRPVQTNFPDGGQTTISYVDAIPTSTTQTTIITTGVNRTSTALLDGYGRTIETQLTSDPDGTTYVETTYDALGRKATVSNPYRTSNDPGPTNGITSYFYDALNRTCLVVPPDGTLPSGGVCPTAQPINTVFTTYSGNTTTVADQAGKSRKSQTDALGRLTSVWEDPSGLNYQTNYTYDAFGDLLSVLQNGSRSRTFSYNAFSQLVSATNPESGTIFYTYDNDGNLATKVSWAQNQTNGTPTKATGSVTISGNAECENGTCDQGTIYITVGSFQASTTYGNSYSSGLASALASQLNGSSSSVSATTSGSTILLTSKVAGPSGNYSLSARVQNSSSGFPKAAFSATTSGSALTGGANPPTVTASYTYDVLNRLTQKSFSDGTPTDTYAYDGALPSACSPTLTLSNPIYRRTAMCDATGMEAWSYDVMGRVLADQRTTSGITKTTSYAYLPYVDGSLYQLTYPSNSTYPGRTITFTVGGASRELSAVDQTNNINYGTGAHYAPAGALTSLINGASVASTYIYNSRLQPCWMYATTGTALPWNSTGCTSTAATGNIFDLKYNFSLGTSDNGNVMAITNDRDNTRSQNFTYDSLNRIATAQTQTTGVTIPNSNCWGLTFGYDAWGNLLTSTISGPSGCSEPLALNTTATIANQISGYCYDAAGNLLVQGTCPTGSNPTYTYTYDAEHHLISTAGVTYSYDGDGKRVQRSNGTIYWYGGETDALDETDLTGSTTDSSFFEYIFLGGKRIARRDYQNNVDYYFADHLGTSRVVTNSAGAILDDSDFYPFGLERPVLSSSGNHYKFTSKGRDTESGLDNFGARYLSSQLGRFISPDWSIGPTSIPAEEFNNPQALNLYSYSYNDPIGKLDPDGHDVRVDDDTALESIRKTLPKDVQASVTLDKNRMVDKKILDIKSNDPNVKALQDLVKNSGTLEVKTASSVTLGSGHKQDFFYQSAKAYAAEMKSLGVTIDPKNAIAQLFLGYTGDAKQGATGMNVLVTISDGTGKAATAPGEELAVTTAHEMYGHGLLQLQGKPWEHDNHGPVDATILDIENRTRKNYERNNQQ